MCDRSSIVHQHHIRKVALAKNSLIAGDAMMSVDPPKPPRSMQEQRPDALIIVGSGVEQLLYRGHNTCVPELANPARGPDDCFQTFVLVTCTIVG